MPCRGENSEVFKNIFQGFVSHHDECHFGKTIRKLLGAMHAMMQTFRPVSTKVTGNPQF